MSDARLDIYLLGEPQPGIDRSTLVRNLAATFKKEVPVIEKMLRKSRSLLKADVDAATAAKYKAAIHKAGGRCDLVTHGEQLFPSEALSPVAPRPALTIAPVEPTALTPAVEDDAPASAPGDNPHYHSPYSAPNASSHSPDYFCYKCGRGIAPGLAQCPYCRAPQVQVYRKEKATAGVLAFFLGGLGVHRFYLGQWWGIFYLIFWGTFIPSIVSFIEAFVFWFTSNERWNQKYGQVPARGAGMAIVLVVGAIFLVAVIGILAAVALPAYQDYTTRAKVQAALPLINETRLKVAEVIKQKDFLPSENLLAGLPDDISNEFISSIKLGEGAQLIVSFRIPSLNETNNTIIWTPARQGSEIVWSCKTGTMVDKNRIPECRSGNNNAEANQSGGNSTNANVRTYSSDKFISLTTPASWKSDNSLNDQADIGVANVRDNVFAVVLRESKVDLDESVTLSYYTDIMVKGLESSTKNFQVKVPSRDLIINGMSAQQQVVTATADNLKVTYVMTTIDSGSHFSVIYAWTLTSNFEKQQALLKKVSESFTEHNGTKK